MASSFHLSNELSLMSFHEGGILNHDEATSISHTLQGRSSTTGTYDYICFLESLLHRPHEAKIPETTRFIGASSYLSHNCITDVTIANKAVDLHYEGVEMRGTNSQENQSNWPPYIAPGVRCDSDSH
jgi:hypothetical protein